MTTIEMGSASREFAGKRAVVTGGTRGIGAAVVRRLLAAGAEVLTTARSAEHAPPAGAVFTQADVRTVDGARTIAAAARAEFGRVDIVVHNAGGAQPYAGSAAITDEVWREALDLNFLASVRLDALLVPGMRAQGSGAIVHMSSAAVLTPFAPFLHYVSAKAALETYSRGLASELAPDGVRVNTVTPGRVATPGGAQTREEWSRMNAADGAAAATAMPPLGRVGEPDDIAAAVLYLASERASWVTGSSLVVDGGEFSRG
ncbi:oxidoreductase [Nocardia sp. NPDC059177]|uniref:oxidoreductase n=1 Tax=Nocardia sp. NPDC059177 TaxID=3346759 RepID=UPI0036BF212E